MNERAVFDSESRARRGFTLIELLVVVALIALVAQLVVSNLGHMIPSTALTSQSNRFVAQLDFIRAEARLQGKVLQVELDLVNHRWRVLFPPEQTQVHRTYEEVEMTPMGWTPLEDRVAFGGYMTAGGTLIDRGTVKIRIDENGFMPDFALFFTLHGEDQKHMVWTVRMRGLTGTAEVLTSEDGARQPFPKVGEGAF
jgi:type II secretion system protein H